MTSQGYVTLALGARKYYEMALNTALSVRAKDPSRPIALLHDGKTDLSPYTPFFDTFVTLPDDEAYVGVANKLRVYSYTPYEQTIFLDGDCLIVKRDMDRHWAKFAGHPFNVAGEKRTSGHWYTFDIAEVCRQLSLPYICVMNSGVLYFEKGKAADAVVETANQFYADHANLLGSVHQDRQAQLADEPFYGAAMGAHGITPLAYTVDEGSIMVTSWGAKRYFADLTTETVVVEKPKSMHPAYRLIPGLGSVRHSPSVLHFIKLKPRRLYQSLCNEFRAAAGVAPLDI